MTQLTVRVPEDLHARLIKSATESKVPLNALIVTLLDAATRRGWRAEKRAGYELVEPS